MFALGIPVVVSISVVVVVRGGGESIRGLQFNVLYFSATFLGCKR